MVQTARSPLSEPGQSVGLDAGDTSPSGREPAAAVRVTGLAKSFGATRALEGIDFSVAAGEIHALVGENGAGKSTLIRILSGIHRPDAGRIEIGGEPRIFTSPRDAIAGGVVTIPQELRMVPALSIAENLVLGSAPTRRHLGFLPGIDRRRMIEEARAQLEQLNLKVDVRQAIRSLSFAEQQLVAIAKGLRRQCRVFILDEPTAALEGREIARLFGVLERMKARGTAIIYISHRLDEILTLADRCTVLRDGRIVSVKTRGTFQIGDLIEAMTGRMGHDEQSAPNEPGPTLLEAAEQSAPPITVRAGQTLGLAGLLGSGSDQTVRSLFGAGPEPIAARLAGGAATVLGKPADAIAAGIGLVPGTRALGLVMNQSVRDNILLPNLDQIGHAFRLDRRRGDALVHELMELMDIRPRRPEVRVGSLSGGNQQKVIIAKWLARRVSILLLDEPTHGIDIAAKMHVHSLIRKFTRDGGGVLVSSSDLGELARLCDTVLAMRERRIIGRVERSAGLDEGRLRSALEGADA